MKKLLTILFFALPILSGAQNLLPDFEVEGFDKNIFIRWKHNFQKEIENISIQRSYDSLKHFSTIGNVFNPQNEENGYTDYAPPYMRMYYRISITFKDGTYIISKSRKPYYEPLPPPPPVSDALPVIQLREEIPETKMSEEQPVLLPEIADSTGTTTEPVTTPKRPVKREPWRVDPMEIKRKEEAAALKEKEKEQITYPSKRIFTSGDQVLILLPDVIVKVYNVKFYTKDGKLLFELNNLKEEYLILEKVYFGRSGWYYFEIFDRGMLIERNRLYIPADKSKNR